MNLGNFSDKFYRLLEANFCTRESSFMCNLFNIQKVNCRRKTLGIAFEWY